MMKLDFEREWGAASVFVFFTLAHVSVVVILEVNAWSHLFKRLEIILCARFVEAKIKNGVVKDLLIVASTLSIKNLITKKVDEKMKLLPLTRLCKLNLMSSVVISSSPAH